ncbi:MAG: HIRAN domain-containing protein [Collinsella sp.]
MSKKFEKSEAACTMPVEVTKYKLTPEQVADIKAMYEPTRLLMQFNIVGFKYWDGALALGKLKVGSKLKLRAEPHNPADSCAVALRFKGMKLGYVPAALNGWLSQLLFYGHGGAFEVRVLQVDPEADPWEQVRVGIYVKDAR